MRKSLEFRLKNKKMKNKKYNISIYVKKKFKYNWKKIVLTKYEVKK